LIADCELKGRAMAFFRRKQAIGKEQLEQLYLRERLSMAEIANKLNCSENKVVYWMNRHEISRRSWDEASYIKHNPDGDPFEIKELETDEEHGLFQLGIGLYIGEGTKNNRDVRLANTNPQVIRTFLRFLREICQVDESKIFAWLNIFDDTDLHQAQTFWKHVTGLPDSQFYKPTVRTSKGGNYLSKSEVGTLTLIVNNTRLAKQIRKWCENSLRQFSQ
jgi:transposase-like protein